MCLVLGNILSTKQYSVFVEHFFFKCKVGRKEEISVQYETKGIWFQISKIYILLSLSVPPLFLFGNL